MQINLKKFVTIIFCEFYFMQYSQIYSQILSILKFLH